MRVVSGGTAGWQRYRDVQAAACRKLGLNHTFFDLGGLGTGPELEVSDQDFAPFHKSIPRTTHLGRLVLAGLQMDPEVWMMGADAFPIGSLDLPRQADVAVTVRMPDEIGRTGSPATDHINSGAMFFSGPRGLEWARRWDQKMQEVGNDQLAANLLTGHALGWTDDDWRTCYGKMHQINGVWVLFLPTAEWNYYYFPRQPGPEVRILHFKRGKRKWFDKFAAQVMV